MHAIDGGERQRGPAILPGAARLRRLVEHAEVAPWLEPELFQVIGRAQPGLSGANDNNVELEGKARRGVQYGSGR
ncbi:hypothetical protein D3C87_2103050 [compost metagenome]